MSKAGGYEEYAFVADLYDSVLTYRNRLDIAFYVEAAKEYGEPVLEIGCGTGRVLIPTAQAEIEIVGMDLSTHMLGICRERLLDEPEEVQSRVQLMEADMRNFEISKRFRLATVPFRPFQHLTEVADQLSCLKSIHRHLTKDGRLILDLFNPSMEMMVRDNIGQEFGEEPEVSTSDGRRIIRRQKTVSRDYFKQIIHVELIYYVTHPDGREERLVHSFPMRYLFRYEVEHLLVRSGFHVEQIYADFDKSLYGSKYPGELIFVAKKVEI